MEQELPDATARAPIAGNIVLGQSDESLAKLIGEQLGPRFRGIERDANGYPIISYVDQSGKPARAYVNRPGLDMQDVSRGVASAVPYVIGGGAVNALVRGAGIVPRMLAQGGAQAGIAAGTDLTAARTGVADLEPFSTAVKATAAGAFGMGGEAAGAAAGVLWRKFVTEPGLFNRSTGQLTPKGAQAAQEAGLDPAQLSSELQRQFAQTMARTGSASRASRSVTSAEFQIPRTMGELTDDMPTLLREQHLRGGNYGDQAAQQIQTFDRSQKDAIANALIGDISRPSGLTAPGIAQRIAPARTPSDYGKNELGTAIRQNTESARNAASATEDAAWQQVPRNIKPQDESLPLLQQRLNEAVGEFDIMPDGAAARMIKQVGGFVRQEAPAKIDDVLTSSPVGDVGKMRKMLTNTLKDAQTPSDRMAAGAVYDAFNAWAREAAEQGLLQGADAAGMAAMATARGISRQIHEVFDGQRGTAGARILADVLKKADSAEGVVNALFTGPTAQIKNGTMSALQNLKTAYDRYLAPEAAKAAWDDIRLAYFLRMVQDKGGKTVEVQQLQSNIKQALGTQESVARLLYTPEEIGLLRRFLAATAGIERKNPNKPWSGVAAGGIIRDMTNSLITALGFNSVFVRMGANALGGAYMKRAYGPAAAARATSPTLPALPPPSFAGPGAALGARSDE